MSVGIGWFPFFAIVIGWLVATLLRRWPLEPEGSEVNETAGQRQETTESAIAGMPDEELYELWAQTSQDLRHKYLPASILSHAQLRELLLDEMTRRHPEVIDRWLADRPDQLDPRGYLGQG